MAERNRDRQEPYRQQHDWNDDYSRQQRNYEEEPNYTISENRGYRESGRNSGMGYGDSGWQSRHQREGSSREGSYYGGQRGREENDYNYGIANQGISSGYADFGQDYSSRGSSRNLYDRGNQGAGRRDYENSENRIGGANYDRYGDRGVYEGGSNYGGHGDFSSRRSRQDERGYGRSADENRNYRGGDYRGSDYGRGESEDRSWWDRTTDEVSSWFGDEDAERRRERDRRMSGQHRGKGPKNYSRSDERIKEDINDRLSDDPFVDATDIDVSVNNGEVTLTGTVDHRSTKRRAEDIAEAVSGVKHVENRLRVSQISGSETTGVSGMNSPSGSSVGQSSSPVPNSDRSRAREGSHSNK